MYPVLVRAVQRGVGPVHLFFSSLYPVCAVYYQMPPSYTDLDVGPNPLFFSSRLAGITINVDLQHNGTHCMVGRSLSSALCLTTMVSLSLSLHLVRECEAHGALCIDIAAALPRPASYHHPTMPRWRWVHSPLLGEGERGAEGLIRVGGCLAVREEHAGAEGVGRGRYLGERGVPSAGVE